MATRAVPTAMVTGSQLPENQAGQVEAAGLAIIKAQSERIKELELLNYEAGVKKHDVADAYETRLFAAGQRQDALAQELAASQQQVAKLTEFLGQREVAVQELQRKQIQDAAQIALGLKEIAHLGEQIQNERAQGEQLRAQLQAAALQIQQLTAQVQELRQMHNETLTMVQSLSKREPSFADDAIALLKNVILSGLSFHHPRYFR